MLGFWISVDQQLKLLIGVVPTNADKKEGYENRRKSLFGFLSADTALEWFDSVDETKVYKGRLPC